jgi:hypothetical protein
VIVDIVGQGTATPIDLTGGTLMNATMDPSMFQIRYAGTGLIKAAGGTQTASLLYAPNAAAQLTGGTDWYGALIVKTLDNGGGVNVHYDRRLQTSQLTLGNAMMSGFTWKKF